MKWKNWYRMRDVPIQHRRVSCTICGHSEVMDEHQEFANHHCGQDGEGFDSEKEALEYAPRIHATWCVWLGAYPVGKRPPPNTKPKQLPASVDQ